MTGPIRPPNDHTGHDGETLDEARDRFSDNLEDPFDRHRNSRGRVGWKDIPHALMNLPVTYARELPWLAGHISFWVALWALLATACLMTIWLV